MTPEDRGRLLTAQEAAGVVFEGKRSADWIKRKYGKTLGLRLGWRTLLFYEYDLKDAIRRAA